jgi:peptidyl-prolyl cis-trans isomerase SurA
MKTTNSPRRTRLLPVLAMMAIAALWTQPAYAQTKIVALVNNKPITSSEVAERRAVIRLTRKKDISAKQALEELIDMQVLAQDAQRRSITISEDEVNQRFAGIGANAKLSTDQLGKALAQAGASTRAFKAEIRNGLLRRRMSGMLSRLATGVSEKEIAAGITAKKTDGESVAYRFTMQQIVFVTPKGASPGAVNQRKSEAESLRRRITSCAQGIEFAKQLRDVAVKPPVVRVSSALPGPVRDQIGALKVGQSTPAAPSDMGVEIIVLCDKQETVDDSALRTEVQTQLASEQGMEELDKFVLDLRKRALVIYR